MQLLIPFNIKKILEKLVADEPREFTLFGKTEILDQDIRIIDLRVPEQTSSSADTELSQDEVEKFLLQLIDDGEDPSRWNCWIHSHNTMAAFWSGTDTAQMKSFNTGGPAFFFHLVVSTTGAKAAFTMYKPFLLTDENITIKYEEEVAITDPDTSKKVTELEEEITKLWNELSAIKEVSYTPVIQKLQTELKEKNKVLTLPSYSQWGKDGEYDGGYWKEHKGKKGWKKSKKWKQWAVGEPEDEVAEDDEFTFWVPVAQKYISYVEYCDLISITKEHDAHCVCISCLVIEAYATRLRDSGKKTMA